MKAKNCVIAWDPKPGGVCIVVPLGAQIPGWYYTSGGAWSWVREGKATPDRVTGFILAEALQMIVRDGLDPQVVHQALLGVDEYREVQIGR